MERNLWKVERRGDGAVLVRVSSSGTSGRQLPDAVFTFRLGDPQYTYWEKKLNEYNPPEEQSSTA